MPGKGEKVKALAPRRLPPLTIGQAAELRPSDVISFSVHDHEETKLFGIMRDEMMTRRPGETPADFEPRWAEARKWNWRRSQLMTAVFVMRVAQKYAPDSEGVKMLVASFGLAMQWTKVQGLPPAEAVKLLCASVGAQAGQT